MGDLPDAILYVAPFGTPLLDVGGIRGSVSTAQAHVAEVWSDGVTWIPPWNEWRALKPFEPGYDSEGFGFGTMARTEPKRRALAVRWAGSWVHDGWDRAFRTLPGGGGTVPVPSLEHARTMGSALVQAELATEVLEIHATLGPVAFEVATINRGSERAEITRLENAVRARAIGACSVLRGASCAMWLHGGSCPHVPEAKWLRRRPGPGEAILLPGETTAK